MSIRLTLDRVPVNVPFDVFSDFTISSWKSETERKCHLTLKDGKYVKTDGVEYVGTMLIVPSEKKQHDV